MEHARQPYIYMLGARLLDRLLPLDDLVKHASTVRHGAAHGRGAASATLKQQGICLLDVVRYVPTRLGFRQAASGRTQVGGAAC